MVPPFVDVGACQVAAGIAEFRRASSLAAKPRPRPMRILLGRLAVLAAFVGALWALQAVNWVVEYRLNAAFDLIPGRLAGLDGILGMRLLHGSFGHLASNTPPLLVMGSPLAATATRALIAVNAVIVGAGACARVAHEQRGTLLRKACLRFTLILAA